MAKKLKTVGQLIAEIREAMKNPAFKRAVREFIKRTT